MKIKQIDDKALQKKIKFQPFDKQQKVLDVLPKLEELVLCCGRRGGKSGLAGYIGLRELLKDNKRIWIAAPTYDLAKRPFDYAARWIQMVLPSVANNVKTRPTPRIDIPQWGSYLECKSANQPKGFLGEEVDVLIIEEAAQFPRDIYENYLYPVVSSRGAKVIWISTPFGKNQFYHKHLEAKKDPNKEYFHWESRENPFFPKKEWKRAQEQLSQDAFNQNYRALFLDDTAVVFRRNVIKEAIGDCLGPYQPDHYYIVAVDIAKHQDFTVITVVDKYNPKVRKIERFQKRDYPYIKEKTIDIAREYNSREIIIDSTGVGSPVGDWIRRDGYNVFDFKFSNTSKVQLVEKMRIFLEGRKIIIPDNETLIDELESFSQDMTPSGKLTYNAPQGMHDDCVDSLGLAIWRLPIKGQQVEKSKKRILKNRKKRYQFT